MQATLGLLLYYLTLHYTSVFPTHQTMLFGLLEAELMLLCKAIYSYDSNSASAPQPTSSWATQTQHHQNNQKVEVEPQIYPYFPYTLEISL